MVSSQSTAHEPLAALASLLAAHGVRLPLACGQAGISDGSIVAPATWARRVRDTGAVLPLVDGGALVLLDAHPDPSARPSEKGRALRVLAVLVRSGELPALVDGRALRTPAGWRCGRTLADVRRTAGQGSTDRWPVLPTTMADPAVAMFPAVPSDDSRDASQVRSVCASHDTSTNGAHGAPESEQKWTRTQT